MYEVGIAFLILTNNEQLPVGYSKLSGHVVFDVKMYFSRKARWVKDGHKTPDLDDLTYAGVVSREIIQIALTYLAMHRIQVLAAEIKNAYLCRARTIRQP